jgi:hypothetical protein
MQQRRYFPLRIGQVDHLHPQLDSIADALVRQGNDIPDLTYMLGEFRRIGTLGALLPTELLCHLLAVAGALKCSNAT